jgi:hypothetical protein
LSGPDDQDPLAHSFAAGRSTRAAAR